MKPLPRTPRSLRSRLLAATAAATVVAVLLAGWLLAGLFRDHVTRQFAAQLAAQLDQVVARLESDADGRPTLDPATLSDPRWTQPYSGLYWQVDEAGPDTRRAALRSRSLWDAELDAPRDLPADGELHRHELPGPRGAPLLAVERTVRASGARAPWRVLVAAERLETDAAVRRFNGVLAASLVALLLLLLAAAAVQTTLGLAPLRALQSALVALRRGERPRLEGRFPSEVQPLVDDFNGVLDRNAQIVQRARTQAGNLAHALKTPLAALLQAADAAQQRPQALAELPRLVGEQVAAARRHVDWHLARARAAAAHGAPGVQCAVAPVVDGLVRVMGRVHAERALRLDVAPIEAGLRFAGAAEDLHEMVGNLLDNACTWARSVVRVTAGRDPAAPGAPLRIVIEDDGPGIAAPQREAAMRRGERLDESVPGSGLGLAIVHELASLYGGAVALAPAPLGGLRVELALPCAPAAHAANSHAS